MHKKIMQGLELRENKDTIMKKKITFFILIAISVAFCFLYEQSHTYTCIQGREYVTWTNNGEAYVVNEYDMALNQGSYELTLNYNNETGGEASFQVLDMAHNNGENELGIVVLEGVLGEGYGEVILPIELKEDTLSLRLNLSDEVNVFQWKAELIEDDYTDGIFLFILMAVILFLVYWKIDWKNVQYEMVLLGLGIFITLPLAGSGLMLGHDMTFHLSRIEGIAESLAAGQFPVRLNPVINFGYGFASEILYPNLFVYIPGILRALGMSLVTAYKFWILFINIGTALIGYYSFKGLLKSKRMGAVCAALYLINPYRLINIFLRASIGEVLAEVFLPLLLYAIVQALYGNYKKWWLLVISATGILQSHILSLEMCVIFVLLFCLISWRCFVSGEAVQRIVNCLKAAGLVVLINAWFLIPFLEQFSKKYNLLEEANENIFGNTVQLYQMFLSTFHLSGGNEINNVSGEMPLTIGIVLLFGCAVYLYYAYGRDAIQGRLRKIGNISLIFGGISCYMASEYFPWELLKTHCRVVFELLAKIQYPWRMLGYASLFFCIVTVIGLTALYHDGKRVLVWSALIFSGFMMLECMDGYITDGTPLVHSRNEKIYAGTLADYYRDDLKLENMEMLQENGETILSEQEVKITNFQKEGTDLSFHFVREEDTEEVLTLQLPIYNYEMHTAVVNGEQADITTGDYGMIQLAIPEAAAEADVQVYYSGKSIYPVGDVISLVTLLGMSGYAVFRLHKKAVSRIMKCKKM